MGKEGGVKHTVKKKGYKKWREGERKETMR